MLERTIPEIFSSLATLLPETDVEIVAVDDGSTDNSYPCLLALRERFAGKMRGDSSDP